MYYYESHLGGWYCGEQEISNDDLYCEACSDADDFLGFYETEEEFLEAYENLI